MALASVALARLSAPQNRGRRALTVLYALNAAALILHKIIEADIHHLTLDATLSKSGGVRGCVKTPGHTGNLDKVEEVRHNMASFQADPSEERRFQVQYGGCKFQVFIFIQRRLSLTGWRWIRAAILRPPHDKLVMDSYFRSHSSDSASLNPTSKHDRRRSPPFHA